MIIRPFQKEDELYVIQLWELCGLTVPQNNHRLDIQRKLKIQREGFLAGFLNDQLVATVMAGYEGHRGWINYLSVHPDYHGKGYGRQIMDAAELYLKNMGCPKINLQVRTSNKEVIAFYRSLGYHIDDVVSLGKKF